MKILFVCVFPPVPLPEADHAYRMAQEFASAGITVDVLTSKGSVPAEHPNITQFSVMEQWGWNEALRLAQQIKRSKPDAILLYYVRHIYNDHPMITYIATIARTLFPSHPMVSLISHFEGAKAHKFSRKERIINKAVRLSLGKNTDYGLGTMLRDSSRIIAMSRPHLDELVKILPQVAEKSVLIPPPPIMTLSEDTQEVREAGRRQLSVTDDTFLFAFFGYLYPGKGIETLIAAFSLVAAQHNAVRLAFIGSVTEFNNGLEYAEKLHLLIKDLDLDEKVIFSGRFDWDSPQGSAYLRASDACVLPFDAGVQMNNSSLAAAVTHGLPVITTAGEQLEAPFLSGENVYLCQPKDPEAMAAAMLKLMNDKSLRQRLHEGALRFSDEWFSWRSATQRTLAALETAS